MWCASLQQRGGSPNIHRSTHFNKRAHGYPWLRSQEIFRSHIRVIGYPANAKAEGETAEAERLSNKAEPLKWLFYLMEQSVETIESSQRLAT